MKVLIAPDSFKGALSAARVAAAVAEGLRRAWPELELERLPLADGGEGSVAALLLALKGQEEQAQVSGPLGAPLQAGYGLWEDGRCAIMEVAAASGLPLLTPQQRDPLRATSTGSGELIAQILAKHPCRELWIGLGGSASTDAGVGLAQALGVRLLDARGEALPRGGGALERLERIEGLPLPALRGVRVRALHDVDNPLLGPQGAARVYAPQKGADPAQVAQLERGLARFAAVVNRDLGRDITTLPGGGAAGGMGAGLVALLGAELSPGAELILEATDFKTRLARADLVICGEGSVDAQTLRQKLPLHVTRLARKAGVPVVCLGGRITPAARALEAMGLSLLLPIADPDLTVEESMARCAELLARTSQALGARLRVACPEEGGASAGVALQRCLAELRAEGPLGAFRALTGC